MSKDITVSEFCDRTTFQENTHSNTKVSVTFVTDQSAEYIANEFQDGRYSVVQELHVDSVNIVERKTILLRRPM